jgi:hypothetical protein
VVSKAKFQKKFKGETRFCREDSNFVYFSIVGQSFLPQDIVGKLLKIWSPTAISSLAIQFLLKFCSRNHQWVLV